MIRRALAALALGGSLFILLSGSFHPLNATGLQTDTGNLVERYRKALATDQGNLWCIKRLLHSISHYGIHPLVRRSQIMELG